MEWYQLVNSLLQERIDEEDKPNRNALVNKFTIKKVNESLKKCITITSIEFKTD